MRTILPYVMSFLSIACKTKDDTAETEDTIAPEIATFRGNNCPDPEEEYEQCVAESNTPMLCSVDDYRQDDVLIPEECDNMQAALDLVSTSDGTISINAYETVDASSYAGDCGVELADSSYTLRTYYNLTIKQGSTGDQTLDAAANIVPATTESITGTEAVMSFCGGTYNLEGLRIDGLSETDGLYITGDGDVAMTSSSVEYCDDGIYATNGGTFDSEANLFRVNYGTSLYVNGANLLYSRDDIIDCQIESTGSVISATDTEVDMLDNSVWNCNTDADLVSLQSTTTNSRMRYNSFIISESTTNGSALNIYGGNPVDADGVEIDNQADGGLIANVLVGSGRVAVTNGTGEVNTANITFIGNRGIFSPDVGYVIPLDCVLDMFTASDAASTGINTGTNLLFYGNDVTGTPVCGVGDPGVTFSWSVCYNNGVDCPMDDEATVQNCDPEFTDATVLDEYGNPVIYSSEYNYIDLMALSVNPDGCAGLGNGNPNENHNDYDQEGSTIGFTGGKYSDITVNQSIPRNEDYFTWKWSE